MEKRNLKIGIPDGSNGLKLRIYQSKGKGKKSPHLLVKCGCCQNSLEIYYDEDGLEINGVNASKEEWKRLFSELLDLE